MNEIRDPTLFTRALTMAARLHEGQTRKGSDDDVDSEIPYIAHLMSVAALVLEHGGNEDEAIAALLHDGPEDQGGQPILDEIDEIFGSAVAGIVGSCSDTFENPKPCWLCRKQAYLEHLQECDSESVFLVSLADKVHNAGSILTDYRRIGTELWDRFNQRRDGTLWYYHSLLDVYQAKAPERCRALLAEYALILAQLDKAVADREKITRRNWVDFDQKKGTH